MNPKTLMKKFDKATAFVFFSLGTALKRDNKRTLWYGYYRYSHTK